MPTDKTLSIIGVPFEDGSGASGLAQASQYLREIGIVERLVTSGLKIRDCGEVVLVPSQSMSAESIKMSAIMMAQSTATKVESILKSNNKVLAIGGDHSISLGTIAGASLALGGDIGIIWIDAHPDACTWEESITKNIHGMQMAALLGHGDSELVNACGQGAKIKSKNVLYIGLKDMDECEIEFIEREGIDTVTMFDVTRFGIDFVLQKIERFIEQNKNIWVSLDMDSICRNDVPSSPMATDEGFTAREISAIARYIGRSANVLGMDVVEMSRTGDTDNRTANLAIDLVAKIFGTDAGWYENYMHKNQAND
jgi:arginase